MTSDEPSEIVIGVGASHTTLMNTRWDEVDHLDRAHAFRDGLAQARAALLDADVDLVVIVGSNHFRGFWLDLMPAFSIGVGDVIAAGEHGTPAGPQPVDPEAAIAVANGLVERHVDIAFSTELHVDHGISHAIQYLVPDDVAVIAEAASGPCDEDQEVRLAALSALMNMNAEQAVPILQEVLQSRDECSVELRRRAVFLISQKMTDESVDILLDLAHRNPDPDPEVREQAVFWLHQVDTPEALDALASILMDSDDPEIQERAIFAISQRSGDRRAIEILQDYAERDEIDTELRANAIFWISQNPDAGGASYLIDLYPRLRDEELKERTIFGISQTRSDEARTWLMERARDQREDVDLRKNALFWAGQIGSLRSSDFEGLYDALDHTEMREQVIFVASQAREDGIDFLMDVAQNEEDSELRERAIFWLGQSTDPRVAEFLLNLIRGGAVRR